MHDDTFRRIGRGITPEFAAKKVKDLTRNEVRDIDTGSYLGAQYSTTRIATMEAVFAARLAQSRRRFR